MAERISNRLKDKGWSQAELARRVGISQSSTWKIVTGETQNSRHLHKIARELDVTIEYLTGESDHPSPMATSEGRLPFRAGGELEGFSSQPEKTNSDNVEICELDLAYGMGGGTFLDDSIRATTTTFGRKWLRNFTDSPFEDLRFARGMGDSMTPTIFDSDIVLIDTAQQSPRMSDQIWAIQMHGMGMIKRLRAGPNGSMRILSDNPAVPEEVAYDGEMQVFGRVVAAVRKF